MIFLNVISFLFTMKILFFLFMPKKVRINKKNKEIRSDKAEDISIDIIVPMFNEEKVIIETINALVKINYQNLNITLIDDGSTDGTLMLVRQHFANHKNITIIAQQNKGKASALNKAIENSFNKIIICIDADTLVKPDLIDKLVPYFSDKRVAAVAGNIKISNRKNLITHIQSTEYMTMFNYDRKLFEASNGILIVPGALGAFRREVVEDLGGYTSSTLAEDTELTLRILCNGYLIRNAADVVAYTEAPESIQMFLRQRIRWKIGTLQVLMKYPRSHHNRILSFIIIPYNWLFAMILPIITPLADYLFIYKCLLMRDFTIFPSYLYFIIIDSVICSAIILLIKENIFQIVYMVLQRFLLRQLTVLTHITMGIKALQGNLYKWDKITRYGVSKIEQQ